MSVNTSPIRILPGVGKRAPDAMLEAAKTIDFDEVMVLGFDKDGVFFMSCSSALLSQASWLVEHAQVKIRDMLREDLCQ